MLVFDLKQSHITVGVLKQIEDSYVLEGVQNYALELEIPEEISEEESKEGSSEDIHENTKDPGLLALRLSEEDTQSIKSLTETLEEDGSIACISRGNILYNQFNLPFDDSDKLDQVLPLQVQDVMPLEINEYLIGSISSPNGNGFNILSASIKEDAVSNYLELLNSLGVDPKYITSRASVISSLGSYLFDATDTNLILVNVDGGCLSYVAYIDKKPILLREIPIKDLNLANVTKQVKSIIKAVKLKEDVDIKEIAIVTPHANVVDQLKTHLDDFNITHARVEDLLNVEESTEDLSWIAGVLKIVTDIDANEKFSWKEFLFENQKSKFLKSIVDFRKGKYKFRPKLVGIYSAIQKEIPYLIFLLLVAISWVVVSLINVNSKISAVNEHITQSVQEVVNDPSIRAGAEELFLDQKISELETKLNSIGSVSSLSPIESISEVSKSITPNLDVTIDELSLGYSKMNIKGSTSSFTKVGQIDSALKRNKKVFCKAEVNNPNSNARSRNKRFKFTADIDLCK